MSNIISVIIWIQNLDDHDDDSCQQVHTMVGSVQEMLPGGIARKIKPSFDGTTNSHDPAHINHPVTWLKSQSQFFPPGTSYIHTRIEVMYKPECAIHQEKVRNIII